MIDEDSDWISFDRRGRLRGSDATMLSREGGRIGTAGGVNNLKVKSKTVNSSPRWIVSSIAGQEIFHSDGGNRVEVCRQDVLELWPERQKDATRSAPAKIGPTAAQRRRQPISDGVRSAINELWPGEIPADLMAKERDEQIIEWLKGKNKKNSKNLPRTIQRVLKSEREAHKKAPPD